MSNEIEMIKKHWRFNLWLLSLCMACIALGTVWLGIFMQDDYKNFCMVVMNDNKGLNPTVFVKEPMPFARSCDIFPVAPQILGIIPLILFFISFYEVRSYVNKL